MRFLPPPAVAAAAFAAFTFLSVAGVAQEAPSPSGPPPTSSAPSDDVLHLDNQSTLKITANLVNVYFSVRDKSGFLTGLTRDDCGVYEEGDLQKLKQFTQEKKLPLTIGILLDTSGSQQNVLPLEQDAASRFLKEVMTPKDEAFLISFDIGVDLLADYTSSAGELRRAINKASINTGATSGSVTGNAKPTGTLLYDAVYLAAHDKLRPEAGRKVIVMLTDGGEQGSQETLKTATEAAQKSNTIIYVILIADRANFSYTFNASGEMDRLAGDTGGRVINVGNNGRKLEEAFDQIQDELRTQYLVSFTPNHPADGKYRKLDYDCGKGRKVQARKGYYAIPGDEASE